MSTSGKPYHHGDLRAALLDAADALLDQGGDGAVSLREAARMAGVSATAAYRHFADKEALLAALALRGFEAFGAAMAAAVAVGDVSPHVARGRAYLRFALARPGRFRLMFGPLLARAKRIRPCSRLRGRPSARSRRARGSWTRPCGAGAWCTASRISCSTVPSRMRASRRR